jgi:AraC family transcriptional activator of pobA
MSRVAERFDFLRHKYGRELLVDVAWVRDLKPFVLDERPHSLTFLDILLITKGEGTLEIDGLRSRVKPGRIFFTAPGQVRRWKVRSLEGLCLFFTRDFLSEFFADPLFLDRLGLFGPASRACVDVPRPGVSRIRSRLLAMRREIHKLDAESSDALRAQLYSLLVELKRLRGDKTADSPVMPALVRRFLELIEANFHAEHGPGQYARRLGITTGHLRELSQAHLKKAPGAVIRERLMLEAKRRLRYSNATVAVIADDLGFVDPSYFSRIYARETGGPPSRERARR